MQHRFYGLRGKAFVSAYKEFLAKEGEAIAAEFNHIKDRDGKFTAMNLGELCNKFRCPVTLMDDCLPELSGLEYPTGFWDRMKRRGAKARDIGVRWDNAN